MIYAAVLCFIFVSWIAFEIWRAPLVDENENIIIPPKKLKDLFK